MSQAKPLSLYQGRVRPEWIDYNGHMNVAYYVLAFDHATDVFIDHIGMDERYRSEQQGSIFTLELHANYLQELKLDDPIRCDTLLLDYDAKRMHYFHQLYHAEEGYLAATNELIVMHMDMTQRRGAPMPSTITARLEALLREHRQLERPPQIGSTIGIRRK
jgi:acyl-CoA thioester hydrolase